MWWSIERRKRTRTVGLSIDSEDNDSDSSSDEAASAMNHPPRAPFSDINWSLTYSSDDDSSYRRRRSQSEPSLDSTMELAETPPRANNTNDLVAYRSMHRRRTRTSPEDQDDDNNSILLQQDGMIRSRKTRYYCTSFRLLAALFLLCACTIFVPSSPRVHLQTYNTNTTAQHQQFLRIRTNKAAGPAFARGDATQSLAFRHAELQGYYQQFQQDEDNEWTWYLHILVLLLVFVWFVKEKRQRGQPVCDL